jgi:hypothetical protein
MVLKDTVLIPRSPGDVWPFIRSQWARKEWDPKILALVPVSGGGPSAGFQCRIRFKSSSLEGNFLTEIMEFHEPERILFHLSGGRLPVRGFVQEIYELKEFNGGTLVSYRLDLRNSGICFFSKSRALIAHLLRPSSERDLRRLKDLIEIQQQNSL